MDVPSAVATLKIVHDVLHAHAGNGSSNLHNHTNWGPVIPPHSVYYWVTNSIYMAFAFFALFEWIRSVHYSKQFFGVRNVIIMATALWGWIRAALGLLYTELEPLTCFPKSLLYATIESYLVFFIYALVLMFFVDCYVAIKLSSTRWSWVVHTLTLVSMVFVWLYFALVVWITCLQHPNTQIDYSDAVSSDFSLTISVLRLAFFLMGVAVFILVQRLHGVILTRADEVVRSRSARALIFYLPAFLAKFVLLFIHLINDKWRMSSWGFLLWMLGVDIVPSLAVVFSFRVEGWLWRPKQTVLVPDYASFDPTAAAPRGGVPYWATGSALYDEGDDDSLSESGGGRSVSEENLLLGRTPPQLSHHLDDIIFHTPPTHGGTSIQ